MNTKKELLSKKEELCKVQNEIANLIEDLDSQLEDFENIYYDIGSVFKANNPGSRYPEALYILVSFAGKFGFINLITGGLKYTPFNFEHFTCTISKKDIDSNTGSGNLEYAGKFKEGDITCLK